MGYQQGQVWEERIKTHIYTRPAHYQQCPKNELLCLSITVLSNRVNQINCRHNLNFHSIEIIKKL